MGQQCKHVFISSEVLAIEWESCDKTGKKWAENETLNHHLSPKTCVKKVKVFELNKVINFWGKSDV